MTGVFQAMVVTAGTAAASFDKAEVLVRVLSGIETDDETIRRVCLSRGRKLARGQVKPPEQPHTPRDATTPGKGDFVVGSCDGTVVNTR